MNQTSKQMAKLYIFINYKDEFRTFPFFPPKLKKKLELHT